LSVKIWAQTVSIPTYGVGAKDKNPMFLEKRVYQGSSGRVYPLPVIDKIYDEKTDKEYTMIFIENEYIQVQIMPELGGRIYRALDKTNQYDFVYYNRVIKPALVGLTGPWISGGIEFNWPQHHRPNTFGAVEYKMDDTDPNKKTVWLSETDRMYGTKVTTGISLTKGVSSIEISSELYNPTGEAQTFLWWANPAVAVHDDTQSIFPPDVHAVMDHGKRDVSKFPIATGEYYKADYSAGVDISRYKNIAVPTSYMAYHSDYDFVGGYDFKADAGILHVADHHIAPGKKQWTWGHGAFGQAWDRNLTDEDGPYIELMTGVFTDNQPDFTWLQPYSNKNFTQYFMPYKKIGMVQCANEDFIIGLDVANQLVTLKIYATRVFDVASILLTDALGTIFNTHSQCSPTHIFETSIAYDGNAWDLTLTVTADGVKPLTYQPEKPGLKPVPAPAKAIDAPEVLPNNEALLLAGLHLEQYRHATYAPEVYYQEGLKRDPGDVRINNAYGNLLLRRGQFNEAIVLFEAAKTTATRHSPNPYDGEVFYNLGKAYAYVGRNDDAYAAYYKATWSDAWRSQGFLKLSIAAARKNNLEQALMFAKESMYANYKNMAARNNAALLLMRLGKNDEAAVILKESLTFDPMNFTAVHALAKLTGSDDDFYNLLQGKAHNAIHVAVGYMGCGLHDEAAAVLQGHLMHGGEDYAMVYYYIAHALEAAQNPAAADAWQRAAAAKTDYCFPNSIGDYLVLKQATEKNTKDANAHYYMGCFLYDKKRYDDACDAWQQSLLLNNAFPTAHRNLALYYANKKGDWTLAQQHLEKAFYLNPADARVFYELCALYQKMSMPLNQQRDHMQKYPMLVQARDDLTVLYSEVLNGLGAFDSVIELLTTRTFHPWEGGEGKVPTQHIAARLGIARKLREQGQYNEAITHLEQALIYFENFGEGKLAGAQENNIHYELGLAYRAINQEIATQYFEKAAIGLSEPVGAMYYNDQPPHMIYYQGLALLKLGRTDQAHARFHKLIDYGEKHVFEKQTMDYFAVSLPDFLVFDADLDEKNKTHCYYMMGLGHLGLGNNERARACFESALNITPNHAGVLEHMGI